MTISSTLSNVLIEGNTIDFGSSSTGGSSTLYGYGGQGFVSGQDGYVILTNADCRIANNYISGIVSSTTNNIMLGLVNCSCVIQENTFVRGSSQITAYIKSLGTNDQIVSNNTFDSNTVDGSSTILVNNLTTNSTFTRNIIGSTGAIISDVLNTGSSIIAKSGGILQANSGGIISFNAGSSISLLGEIFWHITSLPSGTHSYTMDSSGGGFDNIILQDTSGAGSYTINLVPTTNRQIVVKDSTGHAATNNINVTTSSGNIDGGATLTSITKNFGSLYMVSDGVNWYILNISPV